jgi:hypothetical protein
MVNESYKENGKSGSDTKPKCHGDHGEANDHPAIKKFSLGGGILWIMDKDQFKNFGSLVKK